MLNVSYTNRIKVMLPRCMYTVSSHRMRKNNFAISLENTSVSLPRSELNIWDKAWLLPALLAMPIQEIDKVGRIQGFQDTNINKK